MARLKLCVSVVVAGLGLSSAAAAAAASPSPAPPIGDACLVGRWTEVQDSAPGNWTWANEVIAASGLAGLVITYTTDGTETDDFDSSRPLIADYHGHQITIVLRGSVVFQDRADGHQIALGASVSNVTVMFYYDGVAQPGGNATFSAITNTYSCSATRLHIEAPALNPGYGPEIDDLTRPAPATVAAQPTTGGSLVSTVGSTLATPAKLLAAQLTLLVNALVTLALVLLVTFPSHLFNRTYEENHEVIRYLWERRLSWLRRLPWRAVAGGPQGLRNAFSFVVVVILGGVLAALLDPGSGLGLRTLALFAGAVLALVAGSLVSAFAAGVYRIVRGRPGPWHLHALPSGLVVAGACVLISRLTDLQPGYLYGLIGGVAFAGTLSRREEGHVVAVTSIVTLAVALAAWLAWVPVAAVSSAHAADFGWALASNFLAALFVSGMVGLLIGLVPLQFLPGEKLAVWHRGVWGAVFGLAALSVVEVMLRPQSAGARVASVPFWTTLALFVGFGVASILFWAYFRVRKDAGQPIATATKQ